MNESFFCVVSIQFVVDRWREILKIDSFPRYNEDLQLDDAIHNAILTLKESFEGQMTSENIEIGISHIEGFRRLPPSEVKDYLANV